MNAPSASWLNTHANLLSDHYTKFFNAMTILQNEELWGMAEILKNFMKMAKILTGANTFQYILKVCEDFDYLRRSGHVCFDSEVQISQWDASRGTN